MLVVGYLIEVTVYCIVYFIQEIPFLYFEPEYSDFLLKLAKS